MAKKTKSEKKTEKIGWDHPFVAAGFVPEHLLLEVWPYSERYWPIFLEKNRVPWRTLAEGVRWFHMSQLGNWFCNTTWAPVDPEEEPSSE